ncbi:MAG: SCO family protein [Guyparkeria sp.]
MNDLPSRRARSEQGRALLILVIILAIATLSLSGWWLNRDSNEMTVDTSVLKPMPRPVDVPEVQLETAEGEPFGQEAFKGQWTLLYFGYTLCPDVCPVELGALRQVNRLLDEQAPALSQQTQTVFVSVDPERDTPERIAAFTDYFDPRIIGVTGESVDLEILAGPLGVGWSKRANKYKDNADHEETGNDYLIDHTTAILLVDPQARLQAVFPTPHGPQPMVDAYRTYQQRYQQQNQEKTP